MKALPPDVPSVVRAVEVISVVRVIAIRGKGIVVDPVRSVIEYWSLNGEKLAEES